MAVIRPLHPADAEPLCELFSEPTLLTCGHFVPAAGISAFKTFADSPQGDQHRLVITDNGRPIGLGMLERPPYPRVAHLGRISLLLPLDLQGRECDFELLQALIDLAENWLNLKRLEAEIPADAPAVQHTLRRAGFVDEGIMKKALYGDGGWADSLFMARITE